MPQTNGTPDNDLALVRAALLDPGTTPRGPALDALDRIALSTVAAEAAEISAAGRRKQPAIILIEAVDGVAGEFTPHSPATLMQDANALVVELIAADLALIRGVLLDLPGPVGVAPAIDAIDRLGAVSERNPSTLQPGGERRPRVRVPLTEMLVEVWRLHASGDDDDARQRLAFLWSRNQEALATEQAGRVAMQLLRRLAPVTDDEEAWAALPDGLVVYRAGDISGRSWSLDRGTARGLADPDDLAPLTHMATVAKEDVLAYITGSGKAEVVPRPGSAWLLPQAGEQTADELAALGVHIAALLDARQPTRPEGP